MPRQTRGLVPTMTSVAQNLGVQRGRGGRRGNTDRLTRGWRRREPWGERGEGENLEEGGLQHKQNQNANTQNQGSMPPIRTPNRTTSETDKGTGPKPQQSPNHQPSSAAAQPICKGTKQKQTNQPTRGNSSTTPPSQKPVLKTHPKHNRSPLSAHKPPPTMPTVLLPNGSRATPRIATKLPRPQNRTRIATRSAPTRKTPGPHTSTPTPHPVRPR